MTDRKQLYQGYLAAAATLVMWACFSLVSRMAGKSPLTPYDVFALRLITAGAVLLPFIGSMPKDAWRDGRLWLLTFLCSVLYCPLAYAGFKYAPASHGAILLSGMQPFLVTFVAWFIAGTRPNGMRCLGLVFIAVGVVCAAMPYFSGWSSAMVFGDLLIFTSSVLWAFYAVLGSRWGYSPWVQTRAVAFGSSLVYLPIYFLWLPKALGEATMTMIAIQAFFQGVVATVLAMLAYLRAIKLLGPERASAFLALVPIVIGVVAVPLLDEPLTGWLASGIVFVSLGSYVASRYGSARLRS